MFASQSTVLDRLSNEVLEHLLSYLEYVDIQACRLACRRLHGVIAGSVLIRYVCRLQLAGRADHEPSNSRLSLNQRFAALNDLEDAWMRADLTPLDFVKFPLHDITYTSSINGALYILTGTIWSSDEIMRLSTIIPGDTMTEGRRLRLTNGTPNRGRRVVKEIDVLEGSNLLTVVSMDIVDNRYSALVFDFYTADTFEPHPDAARTSITLNCHSSMNMVVPALEDEDEISEYGGAIMDSCGDIVIFVVNNFSADGMTPVGWPREEFMCCIDWRQGIFVPLRKETAYESIVSVSFISENTILIPHCDRACLELCTLSKCSRRHRVLETALYLQLPTLSAASELASCTISRDTTSFTSACNVPPLFATPASKSICSMHLILERRVGAELSFHSFLLVTHCATLHRLASDVPVGETYTWPQPNEEYLYPEAVGSTVDYNEPAPPSDGRESKARTVESDVWSRQGFLWLDSGDLALRNERSWTVDGQRLLGSSAEREDAGPALPLRIFDFNTHNVGRAAALVQATKRLTLDDGLSRDPEDHPHPPNGVEEAVEDPSGTEFGHWTRLPNGSQLAVIDQPLTLPAGGWWKDDLVSDMPFVVTQAVQEEYWPMLTVHGNLILRERDNDDTQGDPIGTSFDVFRIGHGWT